MLVLAASFPLLFLRNNVSNAPPTANTGASACRNALDGAEWLRFCVLEDVQDSVLEACSFVMMVFLPKAVKAASSMSCTAWAAHGSVPNMRKSPIAFARSGKHALFRATDGYGPAQVTVDGSERH